MDANKFDIPGGAYEQCRNLRGRGNRKSVGAVSALTTLQQIENVIRLRQRDSTESDAAPVRQLMKDGKWLTEDRPVAPHIKAIAKKIRERASK